jgi:hypothetical protein
MLPDNAMNPKVNIEENDQEMKDADELSLDSENLEPRYKVKVTQFKKKEESKDTENIIDSESHYSFNSSISDSVKDDDHHEQLNF